MKRRLFLPRSFNSLQTGKSFRTMNPDTPLVDDSGFNSLQTGKSFRTPPKGNGKLERKCFNSLQTGKSFRTRKSQSQPGTRQLLRPVSIPFKRESPFGLKKKGGALCASLFFCFNSLQTGKSFRTGSRTRHSVVGRSFNSLQTGKSFRTAAQEANNQIFTSRFNSLQTGKSFRTAVSLCLEKSQR